MFITNGNLKPKPIYTNEIEYKYKDSFSISDGYYKLISKNNLLTYIKEIYNYNMFGNYKINDSYYSLLIKVISKEKAFYLNYLSLKYKSKIIIFFNNEKRNKKLRVSFYLIPLEAISEIENKNKNILSNDIVYLKSDYKFQSKFLNLNNYNIENKNNFSKHKNIYKLRKKYEEEHKYNLEEVKVNLKKENNILRRVELHICKDDFEKSGEYPVLFEQVEYILVVDKKIYGNEVMPFYFLYSPYNKLFQK